MVAAKRQDCLLVKTASEIHLKSFHVQRYFMNKLGENMRLALKKNGVEVEKLLKGRGRMFIYCAPLEKAQQVLQQVFGIHAIATAQQFQGTELEDLKKQALDSAKGFLRKGDSFAVRANRVGKHELSSKQIEIELGAAIQVAIPGLKVDLGNPQKTLFIEIREKDFLIYEGEKPGAGGLPLGVEGNTAFIFKGKKQELPAAWLMMKRGCNIFPIVEKKTPAVSKQLEALVPWNSFRKFKTSTQQELPALIREWDMQAVITADTGTEEKDFKDYEAFDEKQQLAVLRPLLFYSKEMLEKVKI